MSHTEPQFRAVLLALSAGAALAAGSRAGDGEECRGTPHDDRIAGTELSEHILAHGGDDRVDAGPGETLGGGWDTVVGRDDDLRGGDRISDRAGGDVDEVFGGEDNDEIDVADLDDCGWSNNDKISSDLGDSLIWCEVFAEIQVQ